MLDFTAISPHIRIKISPKAKRLALRLDGSKRHINLVIPPKASLQKAYEFAQLNHLWIKNKINELPPAIPYINGITIPIMGISRTLRIIREGKITQIELTDSELVVISPIENPAPRIARYLRNLALQKLEELAVIKASQINRKLSKFTVRDTKSRWGSCSIDGRMTLSWRLIFAPISSIDYVISHEVSHLIYPNHGENFWILCQNLSMDFSEGLNWMKKNGASLARYGETLL